MGLIPDLHSYFEESWISALYHDQYKRFDQETKEMLSTLTVHNRRHSPFQKVFITLNFQKYEGESLIEDIVQKFEESEWKDVSY